ncbi:MAG: transketolase-like TK C-terminal-containing protein [Enterocloster clostridioformis]
MPRRQLLHGTAPYLPKRLLQPWYSQRQNLPQLAGSSKEALKGAYILEDSAKEVPDAIIIATGSEVELAVGAKAELAKEGVDVRVVSMPSMDVFEEQPEDYMGEGPS